MNDEIYIKAITRLFLAKVDAVNRNKTFMVKYDNYYCKWFNTGRIAAYIDLPIDQVRRDLIKLEKQGKVQAKRLPGYSIRWACPIAGFKQHKYEDYYCYK